MSIFVTDPRSVGFLGLTLKHRHAHQSCNLHQFPISLRKDLTRLASYSAFQAERAARALAETQAPEIHEAQNIQRHPRKALREQRWMVRLFLENIEHGNQVTIKKDANSNIL